MRKLTAKAIIESYDADLPLVDASTPPAEWYTDPRIFKLEQQTVFARSWQMIGRAAQVAEAGQYVTGDIAGEPVLAVRGEDGFLRGFFNVCRHHGAAVAAELEGTAQMLRCPYHGWTYSLAGELRGAPDFGEARNFDRGAHGLLPVETSVWEHWLFAKLESGSPALGEFLDGDLIQRAGALDLKKFHWLERRHYTVDCNWKVYVENYLDGGYHVPSIHRGLHSVLDYQNYVVENGARFCLQSSPLVANRADALTDRVRKGDRAFYCWIYPNFMINCYGETMDTNLVRPITIDRTEVVFDYYFADVSESARELSDASISVSERIQDEDAVICRSVQRGLGSRSYRPGRLSPRREAGEHLFHKLLHADLKTALNERQV
jgi:phenylpropionate dioxygenase-like ring-hydroxylating dioxygenase large terminal subunit